MIFVEYTLQLLYLSYPYKNCTNQRTKCKRRQRKYTTKGQDQTKKAESKKNTGKKGKAKKKEKVNEASDSSSSKEEKYDYGCLYLRIPLCVTLAVVGHIIPVLV